jgi:hypothetical protein
MAEWSSPATLVTPVVTLSFNAASGDTYVNDPTKCNGLDGPPLRTEKENKSLTDGGNRRTTMKGARPITLGGILLVRSAVTEAGYATARTAMEDALMAALASIENVNGTYSWTPTGYPIRSVTVRYDSSLLITGAFQKEYLFGLEAPNPTISGV